MPRIKFLLVPIFLIVFCASAFAQMPENTSQFQIVPGNWGKDFRENDPQFIDASPVPQSLVMQMNAAKESGNEAEVIRLNAEIDKYLNPQPSLFNTCNDQIIPAGTVEAPNQDWGIGDIKINDGNVAYTNGFRQIELKYGEDGNLYLCVNRRNVSGFTGYLLVFRSSNAGRNWTQIGGVSSSAGYYGQVTLIVDKRSSSIDDSTRVTVFYSRSTSSNMDNATLNFVTMRRNGTASWNAQVAAPTSGNKFQYPSACSDGMFYTTGTTTHIIVSETSNAGTAVRLIHYRTTNWFESFTNAPITTVLDYLPSAAFCNKNGTDSIYIATERHISSTEYELRVLTTPEVPTSTYFPYYITNASSGTKWVKPCIAVQQQYFTAPNRILVTCVKDSAGKKLGLYHGSTTGGASWMINQYLGYSWQQVDFTACNADSLTSGGAYFIASYVDLNGDSVAVRRGVIGSMGTVLYKRNSYQSTGTLAPTVAIYKDGSTKYSAFAYAGTGPDNVYFNQEGLPSVGVTPINNTIPDKYALTQNYPNPFNPTTTINFSLPMDKQVKLSVYNILGKEVAVLVNEKLNAGEYKYTFEASGLTSGIYFYKLSSDDFSEVKKMTLIK